MTADLIAKLEGLTGPDRAIDHAVHATTNPPLRDGLRFGNVPAYTASLDAAVSLVERVLPGKWPDILRQAISEMGREFHWHICLVKVPPSLLAKYVLLALFRALEAEGARDV